MPLKKQAAEAKEVSESAQAELDIALSEYNKIMAEVRE
jgi:hypothetical protein